jgi:predicted ATPase
MITRIEIDGFKTFQEFSVDLAPFQVIIGANGSGKSNLFDALRLLSRLASQDLNTACQDLRGQPFTLLPEGKLAQRIRLSVEMLVDLTVRDDWGDEVKLFNPRLRYNLEIVRHQDADGYQDIRVQSESLRSIFPEGDSWSILHGGEAFHRSLHVDSKRALPHFINTSEDKFRDNPTIYLTPEQAHPEIKQKDIGFQSGRMERTLLSRIETTQHPHILAARREMQGWEFPHLNPDHLRLPSLLTSDGPFMVIGNYIPYTLARMEKEEPQLFRNVSRDLASLVPGVTKVQVEFNVARNQYEIYVCMNDDRRFGLAGLSEGTLRLLALVTWSNAITKRSLLCLEEPENAIHPSALNKLVYLLRDMTTDLSDPTSLLKGGRQLVVSTHSPVLAEQLKVADRELLYAEMVTRLQPGMPPTHVTRMTPVGVEIADNPAAKTYTLAQVKRFLSREERLLRHLNTKRATA